MQSVTDTAGKRHDLFADRSAQCVAVGFVTTHCPIANYYQPTLARMTKNYTDQNVRIVLVHANPQTDEDSATRHADEFKATACILVDPKLHLARGLGATITPEAVVIDRHGRIRYRGRIDDTYVGLGRKRLKPRTHNLCDAINAVLVGQRVSNPRTKAIGCYIPFD